MPTLFVSWDNMVCRTAILREAVAVDPDALAGEYATLPCALARKLRLDVLFDSELRSVRSCAPLRPETERAESGPDAWRLEGRREMLRRVSTLRGPRLVASVLRDLVIGTRHSPGIALGVAFAWWPTRRARWLANVAGKWEGLGALRRAANRITL
jgi:hypothetical protein